jgi:hypothetical protein
MGQIGSSMAKPIPPRVSISLLNEMAEVHLKANQDSIKQWAKQPD